MFLISIGSFLFCKCCFINHPVFMLDAAYLHGLQIFSPLFFVLAFFLIFPHSLLFLFHCFSPGFHVSGFPSIYALLGVFWYWRLRPWKTDWQFCVYGQGLSTGDWSGGPSVSCGNPNSQQNSFFSARPHGPHFLGKTHPTWKLVRLAARLPGRLDGKGV